MAETCLRCGRTIKAQISSWLIVMSDDQMCLGIGDPLCATSEELRAELARVTAERDAMARQARKELFDYGLTHNHGRTLAAGPIQRILEAGEAVKKERE